jgi:hypothetical protein
MCSAREGSGSTVRSGAPSIRVFSTCRTFEGKRKVVLFQSLKEIDRYVRARRSVGWVETRQDENQAQVGSRSLLPVCSGKCLLA